MSRDTHDIYALPELYDAQYRTYREDLAFYRRLAEDHAGPVLEIGCGTGRITLEMARVGASVTGVDSSPDMLARARERVDREDAGHRVTLIEADMRALRDHGGRSTTGTAGETGLAPGSFGLAVAPFNTLMHAYTLEDQDRTLAGLFDLLAPGGVFACDVFVPNFGAIGVVRADPAWEAALGPDVDLFLMQDHDPVRQRIVSTYLIHRVDAAGLVRRERARLDQRYYTRFELERAIRAAGFVDVKTFGSFERAPLRESSDVVAIVAKKPEQSAA